MYFEYSELMFTCQEKKVTFTLGIIIAKLVNNENLFLTS